MAVITVQGTERTHTVRRNRQGSKHHHGGDHVCLGQIDQHPAQCLAHNQSSIDVNSNA